MKRVKLPTPYEHDEGSYSDDHCGDGRGKCHGKGVGDGGGGAPATPEIEEYEVKDDTI